MILRLCFVRCLQRQATIESNIELQIDLVVFQSCLNYQIVEFFVKKILNGWVALDLKKNNLYLKLANKE